MINEVIATGSTIDAAMEAARLKLCAPADANVQYEILEQPKKKILGLFGGSEAKVRAYYEAAEAVSAFKKTADRPAPRKAEPKKAEPKKAEPKKAEPKKAEPKKAEPKKAEPKKAETPVTEKAAVDRKVDTDDAVIRYLTSIVRLMGLEDARITGYTEDNIRFYDIVSEGDCGMLIGRRGDTLDSLQYLARLISNKEGENYSRISINVGNYREKRESNLRALAKRTAGQAVRYNKSISLDPMNPYERRIVHTAVSEIEGAVSYSVGNDSNRRVIIASKDAPRGFNRNRGPRTGAGRGGYNRGGRAPRYEQPQTTDRAPLKDSIGTSLYGKIEVKKSDAE